MVGGGEMRAQHQTPATKQSFPADWHSQTLSLGTRTQKLDRLLLPKRRRVLLPAGGEIGEEVEHVVFR